MAKRISSPAEKVVAFLEENKLKLRGEKLLLAVSGGPDSVCLLHILARFRKTWGLDLTVAHLDHQLRGLASDEDAEYVAELARAMDIPAVIASEDVAAYQAEHSLSPEEAAREVRYAFLSRAARETGSRRVATGHTRDDQVETLLMHLVRGSGLGGLAGLELVTPWPYPGTNISLLRPLLPLSRVETEDYCREHGLAPRYDASNRDLCPLRNRLRHELLPQLELLNPQFREAILRTARLAREANQYLADEAARVQGEILNRDGEAVVLDKAGLARLPAILRRRLLRQAIETLLGNLKDIELRHADILMDALQHPAGRCFHLPDGLRFTVEYGGYRLEREDNATEIPVAPKEEIALKIPGKTALPQGSLSARILRPAEIKLKDDPYTAYLDLDKTGNKLTVRARRRGDRFQPLGLGQPKKVAEFMRDARLPRAARDGALVICNGEQIVWLAGLRIDERVKVTPRTQRVLRLRLEMA